METEKLVKKAKRGNRKALEILLNDLYSQLYKTAFIYVGNEQDALDVVQETAFKITKKIPTLKEEGYFKTWATRILIHTAYDMLEHSKKKDLDLFDEELMTPDSSLKTNDKMDLYQALNELPIVQKNSIILYYFQDFSVKEVADFLIIPEGTAKYYLHEARKNLKKILERTDQQWIS